MTPKVRTVDWDKEGRISVVELTSTSTSASSDCFKLALFNIYAVNGTDSPYRDPRTGAITGTRHDRKLTFHKLLMQECISLEREGWEIVLAGDFNIAPERIDGYPNLRTFPNQHVINRADFLSKFLGQGKSDADADENGKNEEDVTKKSWQGVDVWRAMNPNVPRYTYFSRNREWGSNCDRVDYAITSRKLLDTGRVTAAGILDNEAERGPSDHVPIWVDISLDTSPKEPQPKDSEAEKP